jgi:SAM-dependent methyltransferase
MSCCECACYDAQFSATVAAADLKRYRKKGPDKTTRLLLDALAAQGVQDASVLDVGGGVGVVHHELLDRGARSAINVDAAPAYLRAAREEAERRGHAERVSFLEGDFVALAPTVAPADVVTLDRVICCYAHMEPLVAASAARARRLYGAVFPRDTWLLKGVFALSNVVRRIRGRGFRTYLHPPPAIDSVLRQQGLRLRSCRDTLVWRVAVYAR